MIRIKGIDHWVKGFRVKGLDALEDSAPVDFGDIQHLSAEISICLDMDEQIQDETILHEVTHSLVKQNPHIIEEDIDAISSGIYAFLRDNNLISVGWMEKFIDETESDEREVNGDDSIRALDRAAQEGLD